jgi:hypothetical protein
LELVEHQLLLTLLKVGLEVIQHLALLLLTAVVVAARIKMQMV